MTNLFLRHMSFPDTEIKLIARETSRKAKKYISLSHSLPLQIQAMLLVSFMAQSNGDIFEDKSYQNSAVHT